MIMLESQRLAWDLTARLAAGDYSGAVRAFSTAGDTQRAAAATALAYEADLVRRLAQIQGARLTFRASEIPLNLCAVGRAFAEAYHTAAGARGAMAVWPDCDCQADLAVMLADLYLRQGAALGTPFADQAGIITAGLAALDRARGREPLFTFNYDGRDDSAMLSQDGQPVPTALLPT